MYSVPNINLNYKFFGPAHKISYFNQCCGLWLFVLLNNFEQRIYYYGYLPETQKRTEIETKTKLPFYLSDHPSMADSNVLVRIPFFKGSDLDPASFRICIS